jgi:hypothetical protein
MNTEHGLTTRLAREADRFFAEGGAPLDLSQVLDRAGEIKRGRRMRATMLMAACVLAIAVPTVLIATNDKPSSERLPAKQTKVDTSPVGLGDLTVGDLPRVGYLQSGSLHQGGFTYSSKGEQYAELAEFPRGAMVAVRDERDNLSAHALDGSRSWPMEGDFARSADGNLVAFVQPDGTPIVVGKDGRNYELPRIPRGGDFNAVALSGDCESSDCTVWVNTGGKKPEVWMSTSDGLVTVTRPEMRRADDVLGGKTVAGMTSATDDGSCSAVAVLDLPSTWSTCTYQLGSFSPGGDHLSAFPAYFDGAGSSELAVLDARTGDPVLDLHTTQDAFVSQTVWEDDSHLLAVVGDGPRAAILRIGLDGSREYAVPPTDTEPYTSPFVLPAG